MYVKCVLSCVKYVSSVGPVWVKFVLSGSSVFQGVSSVYQMCQVCVKFVKGVPNVCQECVKCVSSVSSLF